jgi:hypothetical protein
LHLHIFQILLCSEVPPNSFCTQLLLRFPITIFEIQRVTQI